MKATFVYELWGQDAYIKCRAGKKKIFFSYTKSNHKVDEKKTTRRTEVSQ